MFKSAILAGCVALTAQAVEISADAEAMSHSKRRGQDQVIVVGNQGHNHGYGYGGYGHGYGHGYNNQPQISVIGGGGYYGKSSKHKKYGGYGGTRVINVGGQNGYGYGNNGVQVIGGGYGGYGGYGPQVYGGNGVQVIGGGGYRGKSGSKYGRGGQTIVVSQPQPRYVAPAPRPVYRAPVQHHVHAAPAPRYGGYGRSYGGYGGRSYGGYEEKSYGGYDRGYGGSYGYGAPKRELSRAAFNLQMRNPKELAGMEQAWDHFLASFESHLKEHNLWTPSIKKLGKRIQAIANFVSQQITPSYEDDYATVIHGDYKAMNVMIGNKPSAPTIMIDFASASCGNGMCDVAMHIHHAVMSNDLANGGEEELFQHYLMTLQRLGCDYPEEVAWKHYKFAVVDYARFFMARMWKTATPDSMAQKANNKNIANINRDISAAMAFVERVDRYVAWIEKEYPQEVSLSQQS